MRRLLTGLAGCALVATFVVGGSAQARSRDAVTISVPPNITVTADHVCGQTDCASVSFTVSASGGTPPYTITCNRGSGDFPVGTAYDTCTATDSTRSSVASGSFTITVNPGGPAPPPPPPPAPTLAIAVPANITATADHVCAQSDCASVSYTVTASGGYPPYAIHCNLPPGDFVVGTSTVICSATDSRADSSREASFTITVNPGGPTPPPPPPPAPTLSLAAPADITTTATLACGATYCATVSYSFTASGGYPPYAISCNLPSGGLFIVGTSTVICSATDSRDDSSRDASFTITVKPPAASNAGGTGSGAGAGGSGTTTRGASTGGTSAGGGGSTSRASGAGGTSQASHAAGARATAAATIATLSNTSIRSETHGRQALTFRVRLAGAATLHVSLLGPSGGAVLRFTTKAKKGLRTLTRGLHRHGVRNGERLTLKVTVAEGRKKRTLTRHFSA